MSEKKVKVETYAVIYKCDECNGDVFPCGDTELLIYPPKIPHKCDKCGKKYTFNEKYPVIKYEYVFPKDQ